MYCFYFDKQSINQEKWINIDKKIDESRGLSPCAGISVKERQHLFKITTTGTTKTTGCAQNDGERSSNQSADGGCRRRQKVVPVVNVVVYS